MKPIKILSTEAPLFNYAGWYTLRYMPSRAKLLETLLKKSDNNVEISTKVMERMMDYIKEDRMIESLVRMWLDRGKTESYIRTKLNEKKFEKVTMEAILDQYAGGLSDWHVYEKVATKRMMSMIDRGKSRRFIRATLAHEYPIFSEEIESLLSDLFPDEGATIRAEIEKFSQKYDISDAQDRQKITQKLVAKGFSYDAVKKAFSQE